MPTGPRPSGTDPAAKRCRGGRFGRGASPRMTALADFAAFDTLDAKTIDRLLVQHLVETFSAHAAPEEPMGRLVLDAAGAELAWRDPGALTFHAAAEFHWSCGSTVAWSRPASSTRPCSRRLRGHRQGPRASRLRAQPLPQAGHSRARPLLRSRERDKAGVLHSRAAIVIDPTVASSRGSGRPRLERGVAIVTVSRSQLIVGMCRTRR